MVRLKDVAKRAGVSVMTVSRVLRDAPDVSASTKARIRQLAGEMGYVPDSMAQSLRMRTTKLLGIVLPSLAHPEIASVMDALTSRVQELGYQLIVEHSLGDPDREETCIRRMLARRVDGIFIAPIYRLAPMARVYDEIRRRGTPVVLLGPSAPFCEGLPNVETDDLALSRALVSHLIDLGHRRIAHLAGPPAAPWARFRRDGYHQALRDADLPDDDSLVFTAGHTFEDGRKAALQMLSEGVKATAVCAATDGVAMGVVSVLLSQGLRIPGDISVTGFGNVAMSEHFRVPLTTAGQPHQRLGITAADLMMDLFRDGKQKNRTLQGEVLTRESSGPPPSAK